MNNLRQRCTNDPFHVWSRHFIILMGGWAAGQACERLADKYGCDGANMYSPAYAALMAASNNEGRLLSNAAEQLPIEHTHSPLWVAR